MQKFLFIFPCLLSVLSLTSCNSILTRRLVRDVDKCFVGAVGLVPTSEGYYVYNYLNVFINKNDKNIANTSINMDTYVGLINLGANSYDDVGNLILYYDLASYLALRTGFTDVNEAINQGYSIFINFSLGSDNKVVSSNFDLKEDGIYAFSTITKDGEVLSFDHSYVEKEIVDWGIFKDK